MEDKVVEAAKAAFQGPQSRVVKPVPVDAHIAPWYPILTIKSLFLVSVRAFVGHAVGAAVWGDFQTVERNGFP
jgi:hypothetical protein